MGKWKSRKWWIVLWSCLIITGWGTYSLIMGTVPAWMSGAMALLIAIPAGYVGIGTLNKGKKNE